MHTTISRNRLATFMSRIAAVTSLAAAGTLGLHAQQSSGTASSLPPVSLKASLAAPLDLSTPDDLKYSSSVGSDEIASAESFNLSSSADQPVAMNDGRPHRARQVHVPKPGGAIFAGSGQQAAVR